MFKKLYCETITCADAIYEYGSQLQKIYPNPGEHIISINFTLPDICKDVKMYIQNPLGQIVLFQNIVFEGGEHTELINVDSLPVGIYYIIIELGAYRTTQPLNVIR